MFGFGYLSSMEETVYNNEAPVSPTILRKKA